MISTSLFENKRESFLPGASQGRVLVAIIAEILLLQTPQLSVREETIFTGDRDIQRQLVLVSQLGNVRSATVPLETGPAPVTVLTSFGCN